MLSNILVAIMCVIALAAGVFGWWMENGSSDNKQGENKNDEDDSEE